MQQESYEVNIKKVICTESKALCLIDLSQCGINYLAFFNFIQDILQYAKETLQSWQ